MSTLDSESSEDSCGITLFTAKPGLDHRGALLLQHALTQIFTTLFRLMPAPWGVKCTDKHVLKRHISMTTLAVPLAMLSARWKVCILLYL